MFVNRRHEIGLLEKCLNSPQAEMLILYGRRRIGKTELLRHFCAPHEHLYFTADLTSEKDQLRQISEVLNRGFKDPYLAAQPFSSWEGFFVYVITRASITNKIIVFDEFPYWCMVNPAVPSILQKVWDEHASASDVFLILCGSYMSYMEKEILSAKSPLFGRRTGQLLLEPLQYEDVKGFLPGAAEADRVYAYSILGGSPAYLTRFRDSRSILENIREEICDKNAYLYAEPRFLLMEELQNPAVYFALLKAMSFGKAQLNEITQEAGIGDVQKANKYLSVLRELGIIRREVPVTEKMPHKSRKGIYLLNDNFFRFWFRYILPNQSFLNDGDLDYVLNQKIAPTLDEFTGPVFESICLQRLKVLNRDSELSFKAVRLGRWWQGGEEIDIVGLDEEGSFLFCECKLTRKPMGVSILKALEGKAAGFAAAEKKYFALFCRSGFEEGLKIEAGRRKDVLLLDYAGH